MATLLLLALALSMDAFAVSVARGAIGDGGWRSAIRLGLSFGLAQGSMPLLGWLLGTTFADRLAAVDHWIAFVLLAILGTRMIREGVSPSDMAVDQRRSLSLLGLVVASVATSIDAAVAGMSLPFLGQPVLVACLVIGGVTAFVCMLGVMIGARVGVGMGRRAEVAGGIVLIGIGMRILVDHVGS
ncbi:manganese efflux pump MntP family protein [Qipengyuania sediminis]|uniref:manganese efflux pump MntP n=1 Tax=Qipengyuania sediminis TaxID=1532023 RepID=UPI00197F26CD|nr:manganese efflux pump MntP family protein [Qipengyuania sediminis]